MTTTKKVTKTSKPKPKETPQPEVIITKPFSPNWIFSTLLLVLFFCISIGALAGFFEVMQYKYPQHFRYHQDSIMIGQNNTDPSFSYIPTQYQSKLPTRTYTTEFACQQPQPKKPNFFDPLDFQSFFDDLPLTNSSSVNPNTQQITITLR